MTDHDDTPEPCDSDPWRDLGGEAACHEALPSTDLDGTWCEECCCVVHPPDYFCGEGVCLHINDAADADDLVRADLEGFGVDVAAEKQKFSELLDTLEASARQQVLALDGDRAAEWALLGSEGLR